MGTTLMSLDGEVDKDVVHIYNEILLSHKEEWNNAICTPRLDLEIVLY